MARQTRTDALNTGTDHPGRLLATLASGRNPDGTPYTLPATTGPAEYATLGRGYLVGSGRMTLSVAGNVRATIANPAGSGRNVLVVGLAMFGTATSWATLYLNPTVGLPATANRAGMNAIPLAGDARVAQVRVDTDATVALSGGVETGVVIGSGASTRTEPRLPFPLTLAPGVTLGINVPFAGAADATFVVYLIEVDA